MNRRMALTGMLASGLFLNEGDAEAQRRRRSGSAAPKKQRRGRARGSAGTSSAYYPNCAAARAAGAAPVRQGDPGYSRRLDRDGDGIGCE